VAEALQVRLAQSGDDGSKSSSIVREYVEMRADKTTADNHASGISAIGIVNEAPEDYNYLLQVYRLERAAACAMRQPSPRS
jgi:hypothetical protein